MMEERKYEMIDGQATAVLRDDSELGVALILTIRPPDQPGAMAIIPEKEARTLFEFLRQSFKEFIQGETHEFVPFHPNWIKPRCRVCREFEDNPIHDTREPTFHDELTALLNRHCMEDMSNTPDFILAQYLQMSLSAFDATTRMRNDWYHTPDGVG